MHSYHSTRDGHTASLAEALSRGLAPDGGLYVPDSVGHFDPPSLPAGASFADSARWAAPTLLPELDPPDLITAVSEAIDFPAPLIEVEPNLFVLELFHGPTHAFKDVGARFMARIMARILPQDHTRTVLVATSGDTGGAVAAAFHGLPGYRVVVLFPKDGISDRQRRQMTTLGGNVIALAVDGTFDDCQRLAKAAFMDEDATRRFGLTSANSINIGRLLPQSLYYVHAAVTLGWSERRGRFIVPCGNLGNLCAGLLASRAGMPSSGFVAATNANDGFVHFLEDGRHEPRPSVRTVSNAMDVGAPSNLERIRWLYRDDPKTLHRDVRGMSVSDDTTRSRIADIYRRTGYVLDPHSAVAYHAALQQDAPRTDEAPSVVLATAHPAKFPEVVEEAIGREVPLPEGLARTMGLDEHMVSVAADLDAVLGALA